MSGRKSGGQRIRDGIPESQDPLRLALEGANVGIWDWHLATGRLDWTPELERIYGYEPGTFPGDYAGFSDRVHPDDLAEVERLWRDAVKAHQPFNFDFRVCLPSGEIRWVNVKGSAIYGADGDPQRVLGVNVDITERKRAEEALAGTTALLESLLANAPLGFCHFNRELRYLRINERLAAMKGIPVADTLGKTVAEIAPTLLPAVQEVTARILATGKAVVGHEFSGETPAEPGVTRYWSESWYPVHDAGGAIAGFGVIVEEITARKQAEEALRASERRFRTVIENSRDGINMLDLQTRRYVVFSPSQVELTGFTREELEGITAEEAYERVHPDDRSISVEQQRKVAAGENLAEPVEYRWRVKSGEFRWFSDARKLVRDAEGRPAFLIGTSRDITERKRAEEERQRLADAVQQERDRLSALVSGMQDEVWFADAEKHLTLANPAVWKEFGAGIGDTREVEKIAARFEVYRPDGTPRPVQEAPPLRALRGETITGQEEIVRTPAAGQLRHRQVNAAPIRDLAGQIIGSVSVVRDITARKLAEEAVAAALQQLQSVIDNTPSIVYACDLEERFVMVNAALATLLQTTPERMLGKRRHDFMPQADADAHELDDRKVIAAGRAVEFEEHSELHGRSITWLSTKFPLRDAGGRIYAVAGIVTDITERKRAEELRQALAEQEKLKLGAAVEQASDSVAMLDLDGTIRYVNAAFEAINRISREKAVGSSYFDAISGDPSAPAIREAVTRGAIWHGPLSRSSPGRHPVELDATISPARNPAGKIIGSLITEKDVTRENALQEQVRQAQKMEALGTLAGGIAHDFNNLLGAIIINTELALLDLDLTDPARRTLPIVLKAANRGKELVKQIITFSRQRTWERKPLEIVPIIKEGLEFLRPTLSPNIAVREAIEDRSGTILADTSHVHQILVNLCQNAVLAMKDRGGRLEVGLAPVEVDEAMSMRHPNLKPGPYARLTVSDTGCGMTKDIKDRIFEPFFTTRSPGEGSGLGLAVVHGIIRTYDGAITVSSEPGKGSTFDVYFPRRVDERPAPGAEDRPGPQRGEERILLVEDDKAQRDSLALGLAQLGYRVTAKADGRSALTAFQKAPAAFDIVLTDQTMPRMTGLELAAAILALRPDVPIILTTGFSEKVDDAVVEKNGVRELIMKPFALSEITGLIRKAAFSPRTG